MTPASPWVFERLVPKAGLKSIQLNLDFDETELA